MRSTTVLTSILLLLAASAPAAVNPPSPALFSDSILVTARPVHLVEIPPGKAFEVAFKVGEVDIEARPVRQASLEVDATCREISRELCERRLARLRLVTRELDDRVRVQLAGMSRREMRKLGVEATIVVPERAPLVVRMGIGDLRIDAGPEDLEVGMSIGALEVTAPSSSVSSVGISTRIGDASLETVDHRRDGYRRMLIGAKLRWEDGPGEARIAVKLGVGDALVRLE